MSLLLPAQDRNIKNSDVVVWHSFGVTHVPRIEDWCACCSFPVHDVFRGHPSADPCMTFFAGNFSRSLAALANVPLPCDGTCVEAGTGWCRPVMPVEHTGFHLKPFNFFDANPASRELAGACDSCGPAARL